MQRRRSGGATGGFSNTRWELDIDVEATDVVAVPFT